MLQTSESTIDNSGAKRSDLHLPRKIWHMGMGSLCLVFYYSFVERESLALLAFVVAVLGFVWDILRIKNRKVNEIAFKIGGPLYRDSEKSGISGLPYYALGISLSLFFYKENIALLSIWFLVFSDPISSLFGILFGKDKVLPNKSIQGSAAGFCTCYLITLFYCLKISGVTENLVLFSLIAGLIGSISELLSAFKVDDNLTIPVVSGLGLSVLNHFFQVL